MQLGGAVVFILGLITLVDRNFLSELLGTNLFSGAVYVLVITSGLVCLLSFFGCFGAVREIKCMLLTVSRVRIACQCELIEGRSGADFAEADSPDVLFKRRQARTQFGVVFVQFYLHPPFVHNSIQLTSLYLLARLFLRFFTTSSDRDLGYIHFASLFVKFHTTRSTPIRL